jgi:hypothetical protein
MIKVLELDRAQRALAEGVVQQQAQGYGVAQVGLAADDCVALIDTDEALKAVGLEE